MPTKAEKLWWAFFCQLAFRLRGYGEVAFGECMPRKVKALWGFFYPCITNVCKGAAVLKVECSHSNARNIRRPTRDPYT